MTYEVDTIIISILKIGKPRLNRTKWVAPELFDSRTRMVSEQKGIHAEVSQGYRWLKKVKHTTSLMCLSDTLRVSKRGLWDVTFPKLEEQICLSNPTHGMHSKCKFSFVSHHLSKFFSGRSTFLAPEWKLDKARFSCHLVIRSLIYFKLETVSWVNN